MLSVFYEFLLCFKILFLRFTHIVHVTLIHSSLVFHRSPLLGKPQSVCIFLLLKDICGHSVYLFYYHLKVVTNLLPYLVLLIITHFRISLSSFKNKYFGNLIVIPLNLSRFRNGVVMIVLGEAHWLKPPTLARPFSSHSHELFYDRRSW